MNTTTEPTPTQLAASNVRALIAAGIVAQRRAIDRDLPAVCELAAHDTGSGAQDQSVERNLYAARRLYGVTIGPVRVVHRRPTIDETRTWVLPQADGHLIVVLAPSGAAVYRPQGAEAHLLHIEELITARFLERCAEGLPLPE